MFFFQVGNTNTSVSVLSREEKKYVRGLSVKLRISSQHGNFKSVCWQYFGQLTDDEGNALERVK